MGLKKNILFILILLVLNLFIFNTFNYTNAFDTDTTIVTINNLDSYKNINKYNFGKKYKNVGDYIYQIIKKIMAKFVYKYPSIHSFKEIPKFKAIHKKINIVLQNTKINPKAKAIYWYLDDLIYNYSDLLYSDLLKYKDNNKKNSNINPSNGNYSQSKYGSNNTFYDRDIIKDNLNNQLIYEYMCSEDYTKSVVDYGCGTKEPNNHIYKKRIETAKYERSLGYKGVSKYNYIQSIDFIRKNLSSNKIKNFLYKSAYLLSPGGFIYGYLFSKNGFEHNVLSQTLWTVIGKHDKENVAYWQELKGKMMKILTDNNLRPYQYTKFKIIMDYLKNTK